VKFSAAHPVKIGGANPQFRVRFYDAGNAFLSEQWRSFASADSTWTQFDVTNTAPANAAFMELFFIQAVGAGASWDWVTLIDNITVNALSTVGPVNVVTPTVHSGVSFAATVQTNGFLANDATGTVTFQTNAVQLSVNGVSFGTGSSANAILLPPYTVTAIYSGDSTYLPSTNTLTVNTTAVTVQLSNLSQAYDGTPKSVTVTTAPEGFPVQLTYDGSPNAPVEVGTYEVIGTVLDNDYQGSATNNLVIVGDVIVYTPTNITTSVSGNQLTIQWPESHLGWTLQSQTNGLNVIPTFNPLVCSRRPTD
ncbi:MAG: MBG domain-containing protein, partial [Verrucomicrobiota bacterium]